MRIRYWIALAGCLLAAGGATAHAQQTSAQSALTAEEARALAEWTQRQAELAAAKGDAGAAEAQGLAAWAKSQAESLGGRMQAAPIAAPTSAPIVNSHAASPGGASVVRAAAYQNIQEEVPPAPGTPMPQPVADPVPGEEIVQGVPPVFGGMWDACCACCQAGVIGGVEGTFLAPINEPSQRVVLTDLLEGQEWRDSAEYGFGGGVRTWIGLQNCTGTGFVFRFWTFGDENAVPKPVVPTDTETAAFASASYLNMQVYDVELTQRMCWHDCRIYASFGARYANIERNKTIVGYGDVGDVSVTGLAVGANDMDGCGITYSLAGVTPMRHCCMPCGWYWYYGFRGSTLWADVSASALTEATAVVNTGNITGTANSRDKSYAAGDDMCLYAAEVFAGVQYEQCLCCIPASLFLRAGFEYQHWETGDVRAQSSSFAFLAGGPPAFGGRADAFSRAHDGDLDLIGFAIAAGLTY